MQNGNTRGFRVNSLNDEIIFAKHRIDCRRFGAVALIGARAILILSRAERGYSREKAERQKRMINALSVEMKTADRRCSSRQSKVELHRRAKRNNNCKRSLFRA